MGLNTHVVFYSLFGWSHIGIPGIKYLYIVSLPTQQMRVIGDYISYHYVYFFKHLKLNLYFFSLLPFLVFILQSIVALLHWSLELLLHPNQTFHTDYVKTVVRNQTLILMMLKGLQMEPEWEVNRKKNIKGETKTTWTNGNA